MTSFLYTCYIRQLPFNTGEGGGLGKFGWQLKKLIITPLHMHEQVHSLTFELIIYIYSVCHENSLFKTFVKMFASDVCKNIQPLPGPKKIQIPQISRGYPAWVKNRKWSGGSEHDQHPKRGFSILGQHFEKNNMYLIYLNVRMGT